MPRLLHPKIAQFLADDPNKHEAVSARRISYTARSNRYEIRVRGITADGNRMETVDVIDATESGISGGGSQPDGIEQAIKMWLKQAGVEK